QHCRLIIACFLGSKTVSMALLIKKIKRNIIFYESSMEYEWDNYKAVSNLSKHGVSFEEAKTVFDDSLYVDFYDPDHSHSEHRFILLGESIQSRLLFVSYMERDNVIRIISAREATQSERKAYEQK
ncbi:MAG: BrnT family toxin, partial [Methylococcales bacterium]